MARRTASGKLIVPLPHSTKENASNPVGDGQWWAKDTANHRAATLWDTVTLLEKHHHGRQMRDAFYVGLYENRPPYWMGAVDQQVPIRPVSWDYRGKRVTLNVFRSVLDTAAAMLAKNNAEVRVITSGGTWNEQKRAKQLTKYLAGVWRLADYHRHKQRIFLDGCLTSARGIIEFWADKAKGRICAARRHPRTVLWNDCEGDDPRNLYMRYAFPRSGLLAAFGSNPQARAAIESAPKSRNPTNPAYRRTSGLHEHADMVDVAKAWHLPDGPKTPGVHLVVIPGSDSHGPTVLNDGAHEWRHNFFPLADFSWQDADEGWGGRPAAEILDGYQVEIGQMVRIWRTALRRAASMAGPWVEDTGETIMDELTDAGLWKPRKYRGQPPVFANPPALNAEFFSGLNWLYDKCFAEFGLSMLQSQGEKPKGLDSGEALVQYNDITATRQVIPGQRLERTDVQAGHICIGLSKDLYANNKDLRVLAPGTKFLEEIRWKDVDMEEDAYALQSYAVSALPTHVVGRIDAVVKLIKGGLIPPEEVERGIGLKLLNFPDLEKWLTTSTANQELVQMQADSALYEGEYIGPEPYQDLALLKTHAAQQLVHAYTLKGVPSRNLRLLERLAGQAHTFQQRALQAAQPAAPAQPQGQQPQQAQPAQPQAPGLAGPTLPVPAVPTTAPALPGAPLPSA